MTIYELFKIVVSNPDKLLVCHVERKDWILVDSKRAFSEDGFLVKEINMRGKYGSDEYFMVPYFKEIETNYQDVKFESFFTYDPNTSFLDCVRQMDLFDDYLDYYIKKSALKYCRWFDHWGTPLEDASNEQIISIKDKIESIYHKMIISKRNVMTYTKIYSEGVTYFIGFVFLKNGDLILLFDNHERNFESLKLLGSGRSSNLQPRILITLNNVVTITRREKPSYLPDDKSEIGKDGLMSVIYYDSGYEHLNHLNEVQAIMVLDALTAFNEVALSVAFASNKYEGKPKYNKLLIECSHYKDGTELETCRAFEDPEEMTPKTFFYFFGNAKFDHLVDAKIIDKTMQFGTMCIGCAKDGEDSQVYAGEYESIFYDPESKNVFAKIITTDPYDDCPEQAIVRNVCKNLIKLGVPHKIVVNNFFDEMLLNKALDKYIKDKQVEVICDQKKKDLEVFEILKDDSYFDWEDGILA